MSNQAVGSVYATIIEKVIQASQNDFEEFGVDNSTLDEMKQGWQEKLSALKVANFPWDPQPEPQRQPPTVPSNVKSEAEASPAISAPQQEHVNFPNIKSERGYDQPLSAYPPMPVNGYSGGFNGDIAQQRAHALVAQRLGQTATNIQIPSQQQASPYAGQQRMMPGQGQQRPPPQMQQRPPQSGHVYNSQTDGSDGALEDWNALIAAKARQGDDGPDGRIAADNLMRTRVDAMMADHDNGLGMALSEMPQGRKQKAITRLRQELKAESSSATSSALHTGRFDGDDAKEPEEDPDDAINSDLDDPEDDMDGGDNSDDEMLDYMLCTYDKVQRVKNKWKCTLKDGILTTNKKEYLFHKATGEFEW